MLLIAGNEHSDGIAIRERGIETRGRGRSDALLRGLLFGPNGERMAPTYTNKKGLIYRYYVARAERRYGASANTTERIAALDVEAAAVGQIKTVLSSPEAIAAVCQTIHRHGATLDEPAIVPASSRLGEIWEQLYPNEQHPHRPVDDRARRPLVPGCLRIRWRELGRKELIREFAPESIGAELVELEDVA